MDRVFWLTFYEGGKFCSRLASPFQTEGEARNALAAYAVSISSIGFAINTQPDGFTYDRYGTPCMIRIEEVE